MSDEDDNDELPRIAPGRAPLEIVQDAPHPARPAENTKGSVAGYNPYESGMLSKDKRRKTDLRALSQWIEMRKRMEGGK